MNWLVFHIAGGDAFFTGVACIAIAAGLGFKNNPGARRVATLVCIFGLIVIAFSATPLPYWFYAIAAGVSVVWMFVVRSDKTTPRRRRIVVAAFLGVWSVALIWEIPFHIAPRADVADDETIVIYGDSITAGMGENEAETWPNILRRTKGANIIDRSRMGATVSSVRNSAERNAAPRGTVILEIGGNDLLGSTTIAEFERNLDRLLDVLSRRHRQIVMFELPLPPLCNSFGRVQRGLAAKHEVHLIPKRVLMGILAGDGATLDSIHLTQQGQDQMAATVWRILGR